MHNGPPQRPMPEKRKNFMARSTYELFQKQVPYMEDLYENKEDMQRNDYIKNRSQILSIERPYTSTVRQRGTFYSQKNTFGTDRNFPEVKLCIYNYIQKQKHHQQPPAYGPFKNPNLPHKGYNKTIGSNWPYIEDPERDPIMYQKDAKGPIWRGPTHSVQTPIKTIHDYFRNS